MASRGRPPAELASVGEQPGRLTIRAADGGLDAFRPAFVGRRQRHLDSLFETRIAPANGRGGLGLRFTEDFTLCLVAERAPSGTGTRITARASIPTLSQSWSTEVAGDQVTLRLVTQIPPRGRAPWFPPGDRIRLTVVDDTGAETQLAEVDGRFWSVETSATFTGRVTGMFAEEGTVHFADFRYRGEGGS